MRMRLSYKLGKAHNSLTPSIWFVLTFNIDVGVNLVFLNNYLYLSEESANRDRTTPNNRTEALGQSDESCKFHMPFDVTYVNLFKF